MKSYGFPYAKGPEFVIFPSSKSFSTDETSFHSQDTAVGFLAAILIGDVGEIVWISDSAGELGSWRKQR